MNYEEYHKTPHHNNCMHGFASTAYGKRLDIESMY